MNKAGINILVQLFLRRYVFMSLGQILQNGITESDREGYLTL